MTQVRETPPSLDDPATVVSDLERFIHGEVADTGSSGVVVNLSGGIDSTVAATIATGALGSDRVTGLILPTGTNRTENIDDAIQVAEELVIDHRVIDLQDLLDTFTKTVSTITRNVPSDPMDNTHATMTVAVGPREDYPVAVGNAAARMRMMVAYFEANTTNRLVLGTGNRTELLVGYFTKYGDGGVDLLPLGDLYKHEVWELARELEVRDRIIEKTPTAGLQLGQSDEDEFGARYDLVDVILWNLCEENLGSDRIAEGLAIDQSLVERFDVLNRRSAHKRRMPRLPSDRDIRLARI